MKKDIQIMQIFKLSTVALSLLLILSGCDTGPRDRRTRTTYNSPLDSTTTSQGNITNTTNPATTTTTTTATVMATASPTVNEDYLNTPGFSKCTIRRNSTFKYQNSIIGPMSVCASLVDETIIRVKFANAEVNGRTCIFPTFKDQTGQSFYLGSAECFTHDANQIIDLKLYKNRGGYFSQYPINGIMVMKQDLIYQYTDCMNEVDPYVMWSKCTQFKNTQGYLDIPL